MISKDLPESSPPLSTDPNGCIKPQKVEACSSCQGMGYYTDFGYDEPRSRDCDACHGLGYQEKLNE